jgi:predicted XRE-type DNA-binding protein
MDRRKNRSDKYQPIFAELPYSSEMLAEFAESQGLVTNYGMYDHERLLDLKEELAKEFWRLVDTQLTDRQRQVIRLCAKGYTQIEIAKMLHVNQSSITKSINGNCDYKKKSDGKKICYGGARTKLKRLSERDPIIQKIIAEMVEIRSGNG